MKILVDRRLCDGTGACVVEAPTVFEVDDDDELILLQEEFGPDLLPQVEAAVRACPKHALEIER